MKRFVVALLTSQLACVIASGDFSGKECIRAADCPSPYSCVLARSPTVATCELLLEPASTDAGERLPGRASYCKDIQPVMTQYCVSCHSVNDMNGGAFQLASYNAMGNVAGAGSPTWAPMIADQVIARLMPLPTPTQLSDAQVLLFSEWKASGYPQIDDGGTPCP